MTNQHPITPPDQQLVRKWIEDWARGQMKGPVTEDQLVVATKAAQWGADMELEAWFAAVEVAGYPFLAASIRNTRRPKTPSLKAEAFAELESIMTELHDETGSAFTASAIRRALEALPND